MIWPFTRRRKPAPERPPINEDWCAGDLACCIDGQWESGSGPASDSIHRVTAVTPGHYRSTGEPAWGLALAGWSGRWFSAYAFVKVRPDAEECSAEFKEMIQRTVRRTVSAGVDQ